MTTHDTGLPKALAPPRRDSESKLWGRAKELIKRPFYALYERRLEAKLATWQLPHHIGIIMDGNRRFALERGLGHASFGHLRGAGRLWDVLNWCYDAGVTVVTVWSFSLDNFQRDTGEVAALLELFEEKTKELKDHEGVHVNEVRVRFLGQLDRLPQSLQQAIREAEAATESYDRFQLNIAMAYGGREEITDAFQSYLTECAGDGASAADAAKGFNAQVIERYLYTSGQPEPDLILRTSGEIRLSGFLLWQSAYSEYYFCDAHWPALRKIDLLRAFRSYNHRQRRMGR